MRSCGSCSSKRTGSSVCRSLQACKQKENDLYTKIAQLPRSASLRKVNVPSFVQILKIATAVPFAPAVSKSEALHCPGPDKESEIGQSPCHVAGQGLGTVALFGMLEGRHCKDYFYKRMPTFFGHAKEQERMIQDLPNIYQEAMHDAE